MELCEVIGLSCVYNNELDAATVAADDGGADYVFQGRAAANGTFSTGLAADIPNTTTATNAAGSEWPSRCYY